MYVDKNFPRDSYLLYIGAKTGNSSKSQQSRKSENIAELYEFIFIAPTTAQTNKLYTRYQNNMSAKRIDSAALEMLTNKLTFQEHAGWPNFRSPFKMQFYVRRVTNIKVVETGDFGFSGLLEKLEKTGVTYLYLHISSRIIF